MCVKYESGGRGGGAGRSGLAVCDTFRTVASSCWGVLMIEPSSSWRWSLRPRSGSLCPLEGDRGGYYRGRSTGAEVFGELGAHLSWLLPPVRPSLSRSPPRCRSMRCNLLQMAQGAAQHEAHTHTHKHTRRNLGDLTRIFRFRVVVLVAVFLLLLLLIRRRVERLVLHFRL